jgi:XapX domain-containing protein
MIMGSFLTGFLCGIICAMIGIPIPAPLKFLGIVCMFGIYVGHSIVKGSFEL